MYTKIRVTNMPYDIGECPFSTDVQHNDDEIELGICRNDGNKCDLKGMPGCNYTCRWLTADNTTYVSNI